MKILLVEDDAEDVFLLLKGTEKLGLHFKVAGTIEQADILLKEESEKFKAIISDLELPDSSGVDTVAHLSQYNLPILVITGNQEQKILDKCILAGADGGMSKMMERKEIYRRVETFATYVTVSNALMPKAEAERLRLLQEVKDLSLGILSRLDAIENRKQNEQE